MFRKTYQKPDTLFVCVANKGRSQMAAAYFNGIFKRHRAYSAGTNARHGGSPLPQPIIELMKEEGYDLSEKRIKQLARGMAHNATRIIVLMEPDEIDKYVPDYLKDDYFSRVTYWNVADGKGQPYEFNRRMRDQIKSLVESLVEELG